MLGVGLLGLHRWGWEPSWGVPPNAIFVGYLESNMGRTVTFLDWMLYGIPLVAVGVPPGLVLPDPMGVSSGARAPVPTPAAAIFGGKLAHSGSDELRGEESAPDLRLRGRASGSCAGLWPQGFRSDRPRETVSDTMIAILGALLLFRPFGMETEAPGMVRPPREIPLGSADSCSAVGLALAKGIQGSGPSGPGWPTSCRFWKGSPHAVLILAAILVVIFLTELTSNTATATIFIPIMAAPCRRPPGRSPTR